jgi:hypothetical protein
MSDVEAGLVSHDIEYALTQTEIVCEDLLEHVEHRSADVNSTIGGLARAFTSAFTGDVARQKEKVINEMVREIKNAMDELEGFRRNHFSCVRLFCPAGKFGVYFSKLFDAVTKAQIAYQRVEARNGLRPSPFSDNLRSEANKLMDIKAKLLASGQLKENDVTASLPDCTLL